MQIDDQRSFLMSSNRMGSTQRIPDAMTSRRKPSRPQVNKKIQAKELYRKQSQLLQRYPLMDETIRRIELFIHTFVYTQPSNRDLIEQVFEDDSRALKDFEQKLKRHLMIEVLRRVIQIDQLLEITRRDVQESAKQYFL